MSNTIVIIYTCIVMVFILALAWMNHAQVKVLVDSLRSEREQERKESRHAMKMLQEVKMIQADQHNYYVKQQADLTGLEIEKGPAVNTEPEEQTLEEMLTNPVFPDTKEQFLAENWEKKGEHWFEEQLATYDKEEEKIDG